MMILLAGLMYLGLGLLTLKSLWNLTVPYIGHCRLVNDPSGKDSSVCLEITLDVVFLLWTLLFAALTDEDYLFCGKGWLILLCFLLPIGSFAGLTVFGWILWKIYHS